jgi:transcription antitermination factor NusG
MGQKWAEPTFARLAFLVSMHSELSKATTIGDAPVDDRALPWYALKVRTRSESLASTALQTRGYEPFVPTYRETKTYSDRIKTVETAAFPGYVFCRFDIRQKVSILSIPAVQYLVSFGGEPAIISDNCIEATRKAIVEGARPSPYLAAGQHIRITSGALAGISGILLRAARQSRIVVSVHLLQRSVAVEIDDGCYTSV